MATCEIDLNQLYSNLNDPLADSEFLNPNPVNEDTDCAWSIKIYYNGTAYEFCNYYRGLSMEIESNYGQRGNAKFVLCDYDEDQSIMWFIPVPEMLVEIRNRTEDKIYFKGYIRDVHPKVVYVRDDYTEASHIEITCTDLYHELERRPVRKVYENKTLGFIARDVLLRYTNLDPTNIDPDLGFVVEKYPINSKYPSQVLEHIANLTDTTYFIDPSTGEINLLPKQDGLAAYNINITDENVYETFMRDSFSIRTQTDQIHNQIEFWYSDRYDLGTVNVSNSSNIVNGYGAPPITEWEGIPSGLEFKLESSDAVYTIEKNNSVGATQELRLSSAYQEATDTDVAYEIRGNRRRVFVSDEESIGTMASIRADDGIFTYVVSEDQNYFTFAEARRFASALLALSRPLPKGKGITKFDVFYDQFPIVAGRTIPMALPQSKKFSGDVIVQKCKIKDMGGSVFIGDEHHANTQITFTFTATLTDMLAQMRKMMQDLRKVRVNIDEENVQDYRRISETFALKDCVHAILPAQISELLTMLDEVSVRLESEGDTVYKGPLFYTENDYTLNLDDWSFTSS